MKKLPILTVVTAVAMTASLSAQGKGAGATKAPHVTTKAPTSTGPTSHGPSTSTGSGKPTTSPAAGKSAGPASDSPKTTTASTSHGSSGDHKPTKTASTSTTTTSTGDGTTTSTGTTTTTEVAPPNAVSTKIGNNPKLLAKVQPQLDALGLTLEEATAGFRNQGQFIAAMNVAKNRNLDFVALQEAMTKDGLSLGQAAKKVLNTPPAAETPEGGTTTGTGSTSTGSTSTGSTGTGSTGTGSTGTGSTGTGSTSTGSTSTGSTTTTAARTNGLSR
jgi:hypothetical protein